MTFTPDAVRSAVRAEYAAVAADPKQSTGCGTSCCGAKDFDGASLALGYSRAQLDQAPEGANLGLGCGNPQSIAALAAGETVVDLGSGGGFDCFLAANQVGTSGKVIGVDMTHEMIAKARRNAEKGGYANTEFRLGEIENLPVADATADVIISNCVINLSPQKRRVFEEAYRILKQGGRLAISDVVATAELPAHIRSDLKLISGCMGGAESIDTLEQMLQEVGFKDVRISPKEESRQFIRQWQPNSRIEDYVVSANIEARK